MKDNQLSQISQSITGIIDIQDAPPIEFINKPRPSTGTAILWSHFKIYANKSKRHLANCNHCSLDVNYTNDMSTSK